MVFYKTQLHDRIPLKMIILNVYNVEIERLPSIIFVGVVIDEDTDWTKYTEFVVNKISKSIGIFGIIIWT